MNHRVLSRIAFGCFLGLVVFMLSESCQDFIFPQSPAISIEPSKIVFDKLRVGTSATKSVAITNCGPRPLKLLKIQTTCGCTTAHADKHHLMPGESAKIIASIKDPSGLQSGQIAAVRVETDCQSQPIVSLVVIADKVCGFQITPDFIDFGRVVQSQLPITKNVYVMEGTPASPPRDNVTCIPNNKALEVGFGSSDSDREGKLALTVTLRPGVERGIFVSSVRLEISDSCSGELFRREVSVRADVRE